MIMATDNKDKVLNVPNLRFPEFCEEWMRCTLGDITENFSRRNKEEIHYPMFSVTNNKGFIPQSEQFEDREMIGEDIKAYKIIHKDDFAYNPARINVGSIAKYNEENPCMISSLYVCFKTNPKIDNDWMMQLLKTPKMNFNYNINGEGGVRIYLFYPNFARIKTSYPTLKEQQKISSFLTLLDERISTQNKIIEDLKKLKVAITQKISKDKSNKKVMLSELLTERCEKNKDLYPVHSVSVSEGIINQIDYLGRSFAANDISNYNVVYYGDIVYTKSPTGDFPYGIVKMNSINAKVSVSPLYGVYHPSSEYVGIYLHNYFSNSLNAKNYLHKLIQKGAKNTINITNKRFLENEISLPNEALLKEYSLFISTFDLKIKSEQKAQLLLQKQKEYLLQQMFI